ncbi:hypothetical protein BV394_10135 [Brevirhabdus pacifica]|uniref:Uncharacterized protein n=1 Tax=Brevirhabdus pacifica TaxID=1267768 RepID=A0A1U7DJ84_9RHOB|nr:DUF6478 family protein [Brevirhabdus pacifica]APX90031.1 hypothetical protein BV394_10135 [Brevirhabdus pacifica]OWU75374.1 hypothetical protein ATO5_12260 [Loktanella sp. 22II-4b]PJJ82724.1 hypothetical protein CLV77_2498 [Brevirhabdus pacifica]
MLERLKEVIGRYRQRRSLNWWHDAVAIAETTDLERLRTLRTHARQQRRRVEQVLHVADARLTLPLLSSNAIRKPMYCDWAYRPQIWRGPLSPPGISAVESQTAFGDEATVFHDCKVSELTLRQLRNTRGEDLAPFGLRMDVFQFDGSFLSLVLDLPAEAARDLRLTHVLRIEAIVELEKPLELFARLNIKHGPNTEQIVRELPVGSKEIMVEFDMAYTKINEKRVERIWLDLIFEGPEMNQIVIRDLTMIRRPRSEL